MNDLKKDDRVLITVGEKQILGIITAVDGQGRNVLVLTKRGEYWYPRRAVSKA